MPPPIEVVDLTQSDDENSNANSSIVRSQKRSSTDDKNYLDAKRQKRSSADDKNCLDAKQCKKSIEEELRCSISLGLPHDPVFAADGRVYEKAMIEEYLAKKGSKNSPYTNLPMKNKKLFPALQYKNIIKALDALQPDSAKDIVAQKEAFAKTLTENLICPVTNELPSNPVVDKKDGIVCERSVLEGTNFFPTTHHKNLIEIAVENGFINKPQLVEKWKENQKRKKLHESLLEKAEGGDIKAMISVAQNFEAGRENKMAFKWYDKAREAGSVPGMASVDKAREAGSVLGMASVGEMLCEGIGVQKSIRLGLHYISIAASLGSDVALYFQGKICADGLYNYPVDLNSAEDLLGKCLDGNYSKYHDMSEEYNEEARKKLQEVRKKAGEGRGTMN